MVFWVKLLKLAKNLLLLQLNSEYLESDPIALVLRVGDNCSSALSIKCSPPALPWAPNHLGRSVKLFAFWDFQ